jgi:hypothetical protein
MERNPKEEINPGIASNPSHDCLLSIQLEQQEKQQLKEVN